MKTPQSITVKDKIIATAAQLFIEKGFDKTSIRDIAKALNMSKGGIYHHFNTKAEIVEAVQELKARTITETIEEWARSSNANTAREKLTFILEKNLSDQEAHALDDVYKSQVKSHDFVVSVMKDSVQLSAPIFAAIMQEGVEDGSIATEYPDECAEVFMLLINIWCDPVIFEANEQKITKRLQFIQQMMKCLGADIVSDQVIEKTKVLLQTLYSSERRTNE